MTTVAFPVSKVLYERRKRELELAFILLGLDETAYRDLETRVTQGFPSYATDQMNTDWAGIQMMLTFEGLNLGFSSR